MFLTAMVIVILLSLGGCAPSRKTMESNVSMDSVSHVTKTSAASVEAFTEQSSKTVSIVADSVKMLPVLVVQASGASSDSAMKNQMDGRNMPVLPYYAASLYGVRLDISNADSSSLMLASASGSSDSVSSNNLDASVSGESVKSSKNSSCTWGIIVFIFFFLAVLLGMRYLKK